MPCIEAAGKPAGCKLIRLSAEVSGGVIRSIKIRGDFFASPGEGFDRLEKRLPGTPLADLPAAFDRLLLEERVEAQGITGAGIWELVLESMKGEG
jgi:hypothetical protein